jgi:hypothetical protein
MTTIEQPGVVDGDVGALQTELQRVVEGES